jgi:hypothetical protein
MATTIERTWLRRTVIGLCSVIPVLVAYARLYRGMHHLSDVVVGAINGLACAGLAAHCLVHRRGTTEDRPPGQQCAPTGIRSGLIDIGDHDIQGRPSRRIFQTTPGQLLMASPNAAASSGVISTTKRPPPSIGMRSTIPRPSLVTSSGPSPVLGFIAAMGYLSSVAYA